MRKLKFAISLPWLIVRGIFLAATWPIRKIVWPVVRFAGRILARVALMIIIRVAVFIVIAIGLTMWMNSQSDGSNIVSELLPEFGCPAMVSGAPLVGSFCESEEAIAERDDFDNGKVIELVGEDRRISNWKPERATGSDEPIPAAEPIWNPFRADGDLAKCERCKAKLLDVIDGDTLLVSYEGKGIKLRLRGVDAFEMGQMCGAPDKLRNFGEHSKRYLWKLMESNFVYFTYNDDGKFHRKSHDRYVADVFPNKWAPAHFRFGEKLVIGGFAIPLFGFLHGDEAARFEAYHREAVTNHYGVYRKGEPPCPAPGQHRASSE